MRPKGTNQYGGYGNSNGYSSGISSYGNTGKYNPSELAQAKLASQHLLKGTSNTNNYSNTGSSSNNYRKAFKPNLGGGSDGLSKTGISNTSTKLTSVNQPQYSNYGNSQQEENFVVEPKQSKLSSGVQLNSRLNFTQKYGTSGGNYGSSQSKPTNQGNNFGSYTSNKLSSNNKGTMNSGVKPTSKIGGSTSTTKRTSNSNYNPSSYGNSYKPVDDNRKLVG